MNMGVQTDSFLARSPATPGEENPHGPRQHILPPSGVPRQRTNRPRKYRHPFAQGAALPLHGVPEDVHCDERPAWYRLRTSAETVSLVVTRMAHGCPRQAIVVAFGDDERTVACRLARAGVQGQAVQEHLAEQPRDLGHVQADEIRVKKQGDIVWMAWALMVETRVWLAGEVSVHRDMTLMRRLLERVRRCALPRPLLCCTDGWCAYIRARRETCRDPVQTGVQGRPRWRPWHHLCIAPVVKRDVQRRVVAVERRLIDGIPARVERLRRRSHGDGVINTASIERLNATCRERLAPLARRGRALARHTLTRQHGMSLVGTVDNFGTYHTSRRLAAPAAGTTLLPRTPAMAAEITDHGWTVRELLSFMCHRRVGAHPSSAGVLRGR